LGLENIFSLHSVFDADSIIHKTQSQKIKNVVIVGGGYIRLELAETLTRVSKKTTGVEIKLASP
jgi:NADPH-dependent 2,4-dienoyl-CoA reductase/sulfur reductase-like enzyme